MRENKQLKAQNKQLAQELEVVRKESGKNHQERWRSLVVILLVIIGSVLIFLGNIFFWAGNTVAKTDRYVATVAPLVDDPAIQKAVAVYATDQIYQNIDVEPILTDALPPRAAFLAPTLASQIEKQTEVVLNNIVASPKFKDVWVNTQRKTHQNLVKVATKYQGDGTIKLTEAYQFLSSQLSGTPLSFLANKQLPSKVGNITLINAQYLPAFHKLVTKIDTWRIIAISLLVLVSAGAVWLSKNRRRTTITLGLTYALIMFFTLIAMRVGREITANGVDAQYRTAVQHAYQIIMHQLATQTFTIMLAGLLVSIVAWITGPYRSAHMISNRVNTLLSGNAHHAIFSHENDFTKWVGSYKRILQWGFVSLLALAMLITTLTVQKLVIFTTLMLVSYFILEDLAAPLKKSKK